MNKFGKYGKHHEAKKGWAATEWEGDKSYFDSPEFKSLCLTIVGFVRMAEKTGQEATFRYLRENLGDNKWLFEAVKDCVRAGLIKETGSEVRTVLKIGGSELRPEQSRGYSKSISVSAAPSTTKILPDFYFENCNRL